MYIARECIMNYLLQALYIYYLIKFHLHAGHVKDMETEVRAIKVIYQNSSGCI